MVYLVAGARPNFMKIAPIVRALQADGRLRYKLIHTGQHYDRDMNDVFFEEFGIAVPDVSMGLGGGSHAEQTAKILVEFERLCVREPPDAVVVVGDVTSTVACSLAAKKLLIPVSSCRGGTAKRRHADAGGDQSRRDRRHCGLAVRDGTKRSGEPAPRRKARSRHSLRGQCDGRQRSLQRVQLEKTNIRKFGFSTYKLAHPRYGVVTLHRPSNVSSAETFWAWRPHRERSQVMCLVFRCTLERARIWRSSRDRAWPKRRVDLDRSHIWNSEPLEGRDDRSD